jgi:hypothetical protein
MQTKIEYSKYCLRLFFVWSKTFNGLGLSAGALVASAGALVASAEALVASAETLRLSKGKRNSVPMDLIEIAIAGGASNEMVDYIKDSLGMD